MSPNEFQSGVTLVSENLEEGSNLFRQLVYRKYYRKYVSLFHTVSFFSVDRTRNATVLQEKSRLRAQVYAFSLFTSFDRLILNPALNSVG